MLYLAPELYHGFVKMQADRNLGRSYAALLAYVEGLHRLGYINQDVYEKYTEKYDVPLVVQEESKPLTRKQIEKEKKNAEWSKQFSKIAKEWNTLNEKSKHWYINKARELVDKVPEAKLILDLDNKDKKAE